MSGATGVWEGRIVNFGVLGVSSAIGFGLLGVAVADQIEKGRI